MDKDSLTSKTLTGFKWGFINIMTRFVLQLIVISILAHLLNPSDFGLLSLSFVFVNLAQLFSQLGVGPALIQRQNISDRHIRVGFTFIIIMGIFFAVATFFSARYISVFFKNGKILPVLKCISFIFILRSFGVVSFSLLQKRLLFKKIMIINSISYFIGYGFVGIILALTGKGVWALVFAEMISSFSKVVISFYFSPHSVIPLFSIEEGKELLNFGGGFTIARIFNYIAINGDNFIVGKFVGVKELGLYSRAYNLMTLPATYFATVLDKVLFPAMSEIQKNSAKLKEVFHNGIELLSIVSLPIALYIYLMSADIIIIIFGTKWVEAIPILKILSLGVLFRTGYKISDSLARATGSVYRRAWRQAVYAFFIVGGSYMGAKFGLNFVAAGIVSALCVNYILMAQLSLDLVNSSWKNFLKLHLLSIYLTIFLSLIMVFASEVTKLFALNVFLHFFIMSSVFFIGFLLSFFIFRKRYKNSSISWIFSKIDEKYFGPFKFFKYMLLGREK